ncbi:DUF262 domain-containing protein [Synechococcus sp. L2F]|uniref:DUF262 domain-containing protein n=1 Tax=Synechococcus sp. L2F TaxID=2823739 RepID=UPI0020CF0AF7|nr:DUF262 domain-containing protein [Synechococcus sp. L2F]MCP9829333.1 DUF262 domain-containing protein [Synechococcus sp. L2F]
MSGFQTPITIWQAIENIESKKYLLPAIQREFVWSASQIEWLFDSLLRKYPISSFLFWKVESQQRNGYRFYSFLSEYRERYKIHNAEVSTDGLYGFTAVLDGQQRLTSLYLGLKGSYAYKEPRKKWDDNENCLPTRRLYLNIEDKLVDQEDGREYEFSFLKDEVTQGSDLYKSRWFKVGKILDLRNLARFNAFVIDNQLPYPSIEILSSLQEAIHSDSTVNFYLEEEQNLDKALNIFIRINSGGEPLNFSDLIMSIAVANWEQKDARREIHSLVDYVRNSGFAISKDFVLKCYLYLFSKDIKFKVHNFSRQNAQDFEANWERIRDVIIEVFKLAEAIGFNDYTLTSKNALLPIIYYVFHKGITTNFTDSVANATNRTIMRKWLHTVLILKVFGSQTDAVLTQIRSVFTSNISQDYIQSEIDDFPSAEIRRGIAKDISLTDELIIDLLKTQKDDQYAFSILAILFPNMDYRNNNFHKDHLHPISSFSEAKAESLCLNEADRSEFFDSAFNNSIINLQMLDANENMSKQHKSLEEWVDEQTRNSNRDAFYRNHLIPDISLKLSDFKAFRDQRELLLVQKIKDEIGQ